MQEIFTIIKWFRRRARFYNLLENHNFLLNAAWNIGLSHTLLHFINIWSIFEGDGAQYYFISRGYIFIEFFKNSTIWFWNIKILVIWQILSRFEFQLFTIYIKVWKYNQHRKRKKRRRRKKTTQIICVSKTFFPWVSYS